MLPVLANQTLRALGTVASYEHDVCAARKRCRPRHEGSSEGSRDRVFVKCYFAKCSYWVLRNILYFALLRLLWSSLAWLWSLQSPLWLLWLLQSCSVCFDRDFDGSGHSDRKHWLWNCRSHMLAAVVFFFGSALAVLTSTLPSTLSTWKSSSFLNFLSMNAKWTIWRKSSHKIRRMSWRKSCINVFSRLATIASWHNLEHQLDVVGQVVHQAREWSSSTESNRDGYGMPKDCGPNQPRVPWGHRKRLLLPAGRFKECRTQGSWHLPAKTLPRLRLARRSLLCFELFP